MWSYLRRKLGVKEQDKKIYHNSREIAEIKKKVSEQEESSKEPKVVKKVLHRDKRVDKIQEELGSLVKWAKEVSKSVKNDQKAINELTYIIEENIGTISSMEDLKEQNSSLREKIDNLDEKIDKLTDRGLNIYREEESVHRQPKRQEVTQPTGIRWGDNINQTAKRIEEGRRLWKKATDAQRQIVKKMYDLGYPITYRELSSELSKSVSTVKNQMNGLKTKGFNFQEDIGANNTKKYLLDPRVKTFLTLKLND